MAYTKTNWANDNPPPLDATNLMKIENKLEELDARPSSGDWNTISATLTYASADSPTFVANTSVDLTSVISVGMKLKLTQTTVKYFIVTAITSTTITLYGGTDYTLANATITLPYFSSMKAPFGFPMNPNKWSVIVIDTTERSQTPSGTTVYNMGGISITIPIGIWKVNFAVLAQVGVSSDAVGGRYMSVCLSTANNTIVNENKAVLAGADLKFSRLFIEKSLFFELSNKTTYYFNSRNDAGSGHALYNMNNEIPLVIRALCAYL